MPFIDAKCRKCGAHIGWYGRMVDMPACGRCGARPDPTSLARDAAEMDSFQELLRELKTANPGWEKWQRARVAAGLTLRQAARLLAITPTELSAFENCRAVPTDEQAEQMRILYDGGAHVTEKQSEAP